MTVRILLCAIHRCQSRRSKVKFDWFAILASAAQHRYLCNKKTRSASLNSVAIKAAFEMNCGLRALAMHIIALYRNTFLPSLNSIFSIRRNENNIRCNDLRGEGGTLFRALHNKIAPKNLTKKKRTYKSQSVMNSFYLVKVFDKISRNFELRFRSQRRISFGEPTLTIHRAASNSNDSIYLFADFV